MEPLSRQPGKKFTASSATFVTISHDNQGKKGLKLSPLFSPFYFGSTSLTSTLQLIWIPGLRPGITLA